MSRRFLLYIAGLATIGALVAAYILTTDDDDPSPGSDSVSTLTASSAVASPSPSPSRPDLSSGGTAEQAAREGLAVAFRWYPATDDSPSAGFARARAWFTEQAAQRILSEQGRTDRGPGRRWATAAASEATVLADVMLGCSGCPPDNEHEVRRVATIHQTMLVTDPTTGRQRSEQFDADVVVWLTMIHTGDRWLIDEIRF